MTIGEYRDIKALSQTSLKLLDYSPKKFYEYEYKWLTGQGDKSEMPENDAMRFGSLVDCKLLTPELFDSQYAVNTGAMPTGQMLTFVQTYYLYEKTLLDTVNGRDLTEEEIAGLAQAAYEFVGFKRDRLQTILERFKTEGLDYYNFLTLSAGKTVISQEENEKADKLILEAKSTEFVRDVLSAEFNRNTEVIRQLPLVDKISVEDQVVDIKGLVDFVIIEHDSKTIRPFDLKTTGESYFSTSYTSRRYDIQAAFYYHLLVLWKKTLYPDYLVTIPEFLVIYTNGNQPELYEMSSEQLTMGRTGGINQYGRPVKGFINLLSDFIWHKKNDKWNFAKEVYENNGRKKLL